MMKTFRKLVAIWVILLSMAVLFSSCRKYEDGPTISFISKTERVSNNWKVVSLFRNDIDETNDWAKYNMNFTKEGKITWTTQLEGGTEVVQTGTWELASVKEQIKITFDEKDPVSGLTRLLYMDILRLTEDELWISFLTEGDYYDLRLN